MANALVLEIDPALERAITEALTSHGYDIDVVHSGDEGMVVAEARKPTLIVVNLRLDKVSGFDFLALLRFVLDPDSARVIAVDDDNEADASLECYGVDVVLPAKDVTTKLDGVLTNFERATLAGGT